MCEEDDLTMNIAYINPDVVELTLVNVGLFAAMIGKTTVAQPFMFEKREKERWKKKQERMQRITEEGSKVKEFRAKPLPNMSSPTGIPPLQTKPLLEPKPFRLESIERSNARMEKWKKEMEEDMYRQWMMTNFKASPCSVTSRPPFVPVKSDKSPTEPLNFKLATNLRSSKRQEYDDYLKYRAAQIERIRIESEQELKRREEEEIQKLRSQTVHRPMPIPVFKATKLKESTVPLTIPISPDLGPKRRAMP